MVFTSATRVFQKFPYSEGYFTLVYQQSTGWGARLEVDTPSYFLCTDHVQLETVNGAVLHTDASLFLIEPVPYLILMEFFSKNKSLRWIKYDLTPTEISMMQAEHPDVTFVSLLVEM